MSERRPPVDRPRVSAIVHGFRWPESARRDALRARLEEALPGVEIIEAHEDPAACIGAAAVMHRAARRATGAILLFIEPSILPSADDFRTVVAHAARGLAIAGEHASSHATSHAISHAAPHATSHAASDSRGAASEPRPASPSADRGEALDFLARLARGITPGAMPAPDPALWAIDRAAYDALDGLDSRLWSIGIVRDLAARAAVAGVPVAHVAAIGSSANAAAHAQTADARAYPVRADVAPIGPAADAAAHAQATDAPAYPLRPDVAPIGPAVDAAAHAQAAAARAYPLRPEVARLLAIRNPLLTAFKLASANDLGEAFAVHVTRALLDAWAATGLGMDAFAFGGSWGRGTTTLQTVARRLAGRSTLPVPLRDQDGVLLPLLAIDSVLDELPSLLNDRDAWQRTARTHASDQPASRRADTSATDDPPTTVPEPPRATNRDGSLKPPSPTNHDAVSESSSSTGYGTFSGSSSPADHGTVSKSPSPMRHGALSEAPSPMRHGTLSESPSPTDHATVSESAGSRTAPLPPLPLVSEHQGGEGGRGGEEDPARVSVIVVNWNGREHLRECFGSLQRSDYPAARLQLICVDNGSTDGSVDLLRHEFPQVTVVALDRNTGFTGGNEAGVRAATGDVFVFLNNDMRVEPDCLRELVGAIDAGHACAGARVLSWDGRRIDFVRGALNFEGRGFQDFYGLPNVPELATPTETFFPNGGAFAVTRDAYNRAGGFDPTFFAYYDDVDLGWRLRLTGTSIRVAARAVVYHRHGATSRTQPAGQKRFLMDRNAFWTLMKNYGDAALRRTLGPALVLAVRRVLDESTLDTQGPLIRRLAPFVVRCRPRRLRGVELDVSPTALSATGAAPAAWRAAAIYEDAASADVDREGARRDAASVGADERRGNGPVVSASAGPAPVRAMPLEALGALAAAVAALPQLAIARAAVQRRRTVPDREILPRFGRTLELVSPLSSYKHIQQAIMEAQALPELFRARTRLLIIGHEALARLISGPAVRVLELGRALSTVARVTIATPGVAEVDDPRCTFAAYDSADASGLRRLAEDADVLLVQGFTLAKFPFLKHLHVPIIVDLYCPFTLEHLEQTRARLAASGAAGADPHGDRLAAAQRDATGVLAVQNDQLIDGDFFICASEAQRDFWIGALHTQGRINPLTYGDDPTLRRLIDVVPFGLPEMDLAEAVARADASRGASQGQPVMRGVWPGIGATDRILLWAGSLLDWQDPLTLIHAVAELSRTRDDLRLVFMGTRHPNPLVSPMQVVDESRALAASLGLLDTRVFFNDWVPYDQRALYLHEADLGLSTHRDHLETHFSFRTRMLDYIWAGLPIVCTRGDFFAGLVESRGLGATVPPGDVGALAAAIARLLDDGAHREAVQRQLAAIRGELRWSRVAAPLARYCAQPTLAADHAPALREYRQRLTQEYGGAKRLKRAALRLGLSEYQVERFKQSRVGRTAMWLHSKRAVGRAKRRP